MNNLFFCSKAKIKAVVDPIKIEVLFILLLNLIEFFFNILFMSIINERCLLDFNFAG